MAQNNGQNNDQSSAGKSGDKNRPRFSTLVVDGTKYRTYLTEKYKRRRKYEPANRGKIFSEFPGTVVKVDVSTGDFVKKGDRLYIYEAMKMKNRAYSPIEGAIREVRIKENDIIRKGQLLFTIE
ncbi:MAG: acetyl-CoA carboxylase biotin carboxyl carrier protein subunit [Bacteroidales bacterium]|nr:acetyl-CoA carboxylase biotin carboxyl carrier protein subunit [Bacteroidales bacterium]